MFGFTELSKTTQPQKDKKSISAILHIHQQQPSHPSPMLGLLTAQHCLTTPSKKQTNKKNNRRKWEGNKSTGFQLAVTTLLCVKNFGLTLIWVKIRIIFFICFFFPLLKENSCLYFTSLSTFSFSSHSQELIKKKLIRTYYLKKSRLTYTPKYFHYHFNLCILYKRALYKAHFLTSVVI